jgi:hypothetical protein
MLMRFPTLENVFRYFRNASHSRWELPGVSQLYQKVFLDISENSLSLFAK